jgi:hypothetical protein
MWQDSGFIEDGSTNVQVAMNRLEELIVSVRGDYEQLPENELLRFPAPGKWSKKQILGHLIDSAVNNLKRFTDAQVLDQPYIVVGYRQDDLVALNHYQELPLHHLLDLWQSLNRQIVFVVRSIPAEKLSYPVQPGYNQTGTQTLAWLIGDYVAHMQHHL